MGHSGERHPAGRCQIRIVIPRDRDVPRAVHALFFHGPQHLDRDLVIVADDTVKMMLPPLVDELFHLLIRMIFPVLRIKPYDLVRIIGDARRLQRLYIALVPLLPLDIIRLEHPDNVPPALRGQMLRHEIPAFTVVHQDIRSLLHLRIASLDEHIRDLVKIQHFIKV